ncbi:MAG: cupin domain-containing protein [bacterium]|nr:cupin domain-containing protein [Betaproteobacteria bacterium]
MPDLSTSRGPVIEGDYIWFCLVTKPAGTGSELHYHPNELLIFPTAGKLNAVVGKDRRIVGPGTFVHAPAFARHSMRAAEDADLEYLYIKDKTWTVVGLAVDERVPEKALSIAEINALHAKGGAALGKRGDEATRHREKGESQIIIDGIDDCYQRMIDGFDAPVPSSTRETWNHGQRMAFGFIDAPPEAGAGLGPVTPAAHEIFAIVLRGRALVQLGDERRTLAAGDVVHARRGERFAMAPDAGGARYAMVRSTPWLERKMDQMSDDEREQSRLHNRAN